MFGYLEGGLICCSLFTIMQLRYANTEHAILQQVQGTTRVEGTCQPRFRLRASSRLEVMSAAMHHHHSSSCCRFAETPPHEDGYDKHEQTKEGVGEVIHGASPVASRLDMTQEGSPTIEP